MSQQTTQTRLQSTENPWRDEQCLRDVYESSMTQTVMAEELGCSVSTVSKWLDKFDIGSEETDESEQTNDDCKFYTVCGNETPGEYNYICNTCIDALREFGGDGAITAAEFESTIAANVDDDHYDFS
jgi:hypothetical protein